MVSLYRKIKGFFEYCYLLRKNLKVIKESKLNLRINWALEIYTIVSLEADMDSTDYQIYGKDLSKKKVTNTLNRIENFLYEINLREYLVAYKFEEIPEDDKMRLVVFRFSDFSTRTLFRNLIFLCSLTCLYFLFF